jgi:uncharacterized membrane protein YkoI
LPATINLNGRSFILSISKKISLPLGVAAAGFVGVSGANLLTSLPSSAASTTTGSGTTANATTAAADTSTSSQQDFSKGGHQANGITETVLTGDDATKATAAAQAAVPGATVLRVETDAEGAKYEAHMKKSDGSLVTVKMDASFKVTSTEAGPSGGPGRSNDNGANNSTSNSSSSSN